MDIYNKFTEDWEWWRQLHVELCNITYDTTGTRNETACKTRNLNKILVKNLNVIWET
jgi:hypothetical protein